MRKAHTIAAITLVCAGLWTAPARAQIPVIDAENLVSNTLTSLMQTWNTIEAVLQTAYVNDRQLKQAACPSPPVRRADARQTGAET